jgi:alanine racemase
LNTKIIQIKKIEKGTAVSYGRTWVAKRNTTLAVLPIGYYDGIDRKFSNETFFFVGGIACRQVGRVCMNLTMIDVTKVENIKNGNQVSILGKGGRAASALAKEIGTINYEVVSRINPLIQRIYT